MSGETGADAEKDSPPPDPVAAKLSKWKERLIDLAVLGVPTGLLGRLSGAWTDSIVEQPWQALWFLVPLAVAAGILLRIARGRNELRLGWPALAFLGTYVLLFTLAARSDLLDWNRELTVFGKKAERSWLLPVSAGDWRYKVAPRVPPSPDDLAVVLLPPGEGRRLEEARQEVLRVTAQLAALGASGVALDVYFADPSDLDETFCRRLAGLEPPILAGTGFVQAEGRVAPVEMPELLAECLPEDVRGHLGGFADVDGVVRQVPLYFQGREDRPALSLRIAELLGGPEWAPPADLELLRFVEPSAPYPVWPYERLEAEPELRRFVADRFVIVGESSERDTFETPFGRRPGAVVHMNAAHALRQGHFLRKVPWWHGLLYLLVACYLLTAFALEGYSLLWLAGYCAVASVGAVALAVVALWTGPDWYDIAYPIVAVWLLLPLALGLRQALRRRARVETVGRPRPAGSPSGGG